VVFGETRECRQYCVSKPLRTAGTVETRIIAANGDKKKRLCKPITQPGRVAQSFPVKRGILPFVCGQINSRINFAEHLCASRLESIKMMPSHEFREHLEEIHRSDHCPDGTDLLYWRIGDTQQGADE
jgi:hypothetical protein